MKPALLSKFKPATLALGSALALSCAVCGSASLAAAQNASNSDGQIEMNVVQALDNSQALKNDLITAATIQGKVTLAGTVASDADKQLAESIVTKVSGVTGVVNNLKVGDPSAAATADDMPAPGDEQQPSDQADNSQPNTPPTYAQPGADNSQPAPPQPNEAPNYPQQQPAPAYPQQQPQYPQQGNAQPQYPPPPGYAPYGQQRQPYAPPAPSYNIPSGPITVAQGTVLQVRTTDTLDSKRAVAGQPLSFMVLNDVSVNGYLAIPRGATVHGVVTDVQQPQGRLSGSAMMGLQLVSLDLNGRSYPLNSDVFRVKGPNKTHRTVGNAIGGALLGAIIGGAAGGGGGAAIGAAAGGTVGTAASAASPNSRAWIPAEALVVFHLNAPLTLDPVTQQEAARLSQGLYQGGPRLYQRPGPYGYAPTYYAYPGPYGYPPVYYRPYYMVGGGYYWR
jgi:hypothetical protein